MEAETRVMQPQAKDSWSHQMLEEAGSLPPWNVWREHGPADTLISDP